MNVFFVNNESSSEALGRPWTKRQSEFRRVELQGNDKAIEYVKNVCGEERNVYMASRTKALVEPTAADIAYFVQGKKTEGKRRNFDVLIAGGGPAGLTCAIYASRANVSAAHRPATDDARWVDDFYRRN
ncbi:MAG: hypothetical protein U5N86_11890 [Planctomycetota bacterium]|nr:hypothetical protein [Planctomycetota bacterium]